MRRYVYVLRPKADNLIDVFGEEASDELDIPIHVELKY